MFIHCGHCKCWYVFIYSFLYSSFSDDGDYSKYADSDDNDDEISEDDEVSNDDESEDDEDLSDETANAENLADVSMFSNQGGMLLHVNYWLYTNMSTHLTDYLPSLYYTIFFKFPLFTGSIFVPAYPYGELSSCYLSRIDIPIFWIMDGS